MILMLHVIDIHSMNSTKACQCFNVYSQEQTNKLVKNIIENVSKKVKYREYHLNIHKLVIICKQNKTYVNKISILSKLES